MCSDILPRSCGRIPAAPVSCFQGETQEPILLIGHRLEHRHIAAKGARDLREIRATPEAFYVGLARRNGAAGQNTAVKVKIVDMHFGVGAFRISF